MIFRVFCCASARAGKRNADVNPAAAAAPPVSLTNFLRLIFRLDMKPLLPCSDRFGEGEDDTPGSDELRRRSPAMTEPVPLHHSKPRHALRRYARGQTRCTP